MYSNQMPPEYPVELYVRSILMAIYGWMGVALALTAGISYTIAQTPMVYALFKQPILLIGLVLGQLALVIILSMFLMRMSFMTAAIMFLIYAASLGVTLSSIFLIYTTGSIVTTFITAAGMFGAMALYGYFTKSDLSSFGSIGIMLLFGLIIGGVINLFLGNKMVDLILSGVGVVVFAMLTAYDMQKITQMSKRMLYDEESGSKIAILGALTLYLDFVNLFLYLLRFLGKEKE